LYVADNGNSAIRRIDAVTGVITTVAGTGAAGFNGDGISAASALLNYPSDVFVDPAGNLWIGDSSNNRVRRVDAVSGIITTVAGTGQQGFSGDGGDALSATLFFPNGIAVDTAGNLSAYGQAATLSGTISPSAATGAVYLFAGAISVGPASTVNGAFSLTTSVLNSGSYAVQATYSGDANYAPAASPLLTQSVIKRARPLHSPPA